MIAGWKQPIINREPRMEETQNSPKITLKNISFLTSGQIGKHLEKMASNMRFFAIFHIIYGVLISLTIIGAIIGVPLIIYNLKLNSAAKSYQNFTEEDDFFHLNRAFENQASFFLFYKVLIIVSLIFLILYFAFLIYLFSSGMMGMPQDFV